MTTPYSAAVETFSADVHVMTIGPAQLTRAMVRQLDRVHWSALEPFGRVRIDLDATGRVDVVGRDRRTGALCRFTASDPSVRRFTAADEPPPEATDPAVWATVLELPLIVIGR